MVILCIYAVVAVICAGLFGGISQIGNTEFKLAECMVGATLLALIWPLTLVAMVAMGMLNSINKSN